MKHLLLLLVITGNFLFAAAQIPAATWAYIPVQKGTGNQPIHTINDMAIDKQGNILTFGSIAGNIADMDPSPNPADTSYSDFGSNYYFSKTSPSGKLIFINYFKRAVGGPFISFTPRRILVDNNNDIIIAADFYGKIDFNPAPADSANLSSFAATYPDMAIAKYNAAGQYQWAFNIKGNSASSSSSLYAGISLTTNNDIVVNTQLIGTVDVDPGPNVVNAVSPNKGCVLLGYSSTGAYKWHTVSSLNNSYGVLGYSCATDGANNSYTYSMGGYATTIYKADPRGAFVWTKTIGTGVWPYTDRTEIAGIYTAPNGDFLICGNFMNLMNFNLMGGIDTVRSSSVMYDDYYIACYSSNGNLIWKKVIANTMTFGKCYFDAAGNFHCSGSIKNDLTLDGITIKGGGVVNGAFYAKFSPTGTLLAASGLGVPSSFSGILPEGNNAFVGYGKINNTVDIDPTPAVLNLKSDYGSSFTAFYGTLSASGLKSTESNKIVSAYPIPASETIQIKNSEIKYHSFQLFNIAGIKVLEGNLTEGQSIDIKNIPNGIYSLTLRGSEMEMRKMKVVVQR